MHLDLPNLRNHQLRERQWREIHLLAGYAMAKLGAGLLQKRCLSINWNCSNAFLGEVILINKTEIVWHLQKNGCNFAE